MTADARLAINASIVGGNPTGLGIYSIKLIRALDEIRNDFFVYASSGGAFGSLRARIGRVPRATRPDYGARGHVIRLLWLQGALRLWLSKTRPQGILNTVPEGVLRSPVPQVTVVHDLLPLRFPPEYPRQQYYFRFLVPRILSDSRLVIADSEHTRSDILDHYDVPAGKVKVIYPGYDSSAFFCSGPNSSSQPRQVPYILYVGNLLPHKNLPRLLDALALLRRRRSCRLIIRGEGRPAYARLLRERIESLGHRDAVTFAGYAGEDSLRQLYSDAVCLVLPSLGEGFGLPVLEAMACGTPVITASASSLPEVAGDAALMVDPYDALGLADAMYRTLTDSGLREDLRQRGLRRVSAFTWKRTALEVSRLLDGAFGQSEAHCRALPLHDRA
jgi:glycosyltransferase involved in cell wall biosynthesis